MRLEKAGVNKITVVEDLSGSAVVVLGLMTMGITDTDQLLEYLIQPGVRNSKEHRRKARLFVLMVKYTDNQLVKQLREAGLPVGVFIPLPFYTYGDQVRCRLCGAKLNTVPCPLCSVKQVGVASAPESRDREPPRPARSVTCQPGTLQKMRVFQARLSRGEALFHPDDYSLAT